MKLSPAQRCSGRRLRQRRARFSIVASLGHAASATACSASRADSIMGLSTTRVGYARGLADRCGFELLDVLTIDADGLRREHRKIIYHLDYPVAGPGAFPST